MNCRGDATTLMCFARLAKKDGSLSLSSQTNVAYLKREIEDALFERPEPGEEQGARGEDAKPNGDASRVGASSEVKAKYRDPKTNETWSGRGRMANWLKKKQDAGEDINDYLV